MSETYHYRFVIEHRGHRIALEPYENDIWALEFDGSEVHRFQSERLNLQQLSAFLVEKGYLAADEIVGMTRLPDWSRFLIIPLPEEK